MKRSPSPHKWLNDVPIQTIPESKSQQPSTSQADFRAAVLPDTHSIEAFTYASHVWAETLNRQKWVLYQALGNELKAQVSDAFKFKDNVEKKAYQDWEKSHDAAIEELCESQQALVLTGVAIAKAYYESRINTGQDIIDRPVYYIDVLQPNARLLIQQSFDIQREARHLSSEILDSCQVQRFRVFPGRCYYSLSPHMSPDISVAKEFEELKSLKEKDLQHDWLLPEVVAKALGRGRSGLSGNGGMSLWKKHQAYLGSMTIETVLELEKGTFISKELKKKIPRGYAIETVDLTESSNAASSSSTSLIIESDSRYSRRTRTTTPALPPPPQSKTQNRMHNTPTGGKPKLTRLDYAGTPPPGWSKGAEAWAKRVYGGTRDTWWKKNNKNTLGARRRMKNGTFTRRALRKHRRSMNEDNVSEDSNTDGGDGMSGDDDTGGDESEGSGDENDDVADKAPGQAIAV